MFPAELFDLIPYNGNATLVLWRFHRSIEGAYMHSITDSKIYGEDPGARLDRIDLHSEVPAVKSWNLQAKKAVSRQSKFVSE